MDGQNSYFSRMSPAILRGIKHGIGMSKYGQTMFVIFQKVQYSHGYHKHVQIWSIWSYNV